MTEAAADTTPTTAEVPRTATGAIDLHAYAEIASKALAEERATEPTSSATPAPPDDGEKKPAKSTKTGKFVRSDEAAPEPSSGEAASDGEAAEGEDELAKRENISLESWRRRAAKNPEQTLKLLGLDLEKVPSKAYQALREERRKVTAREQKVNATVDQVVKQYQPYSEARKLWDAGDVEGAIKSAFGVSFSDASKRHIAHVSGQPAADPRVEALTRQLGELNAKLAQREQATMQAQSAQNQEAQKARLQAFLAGSDDPQIAAASKSPMLISRTIEQLRAHWDESTRTSIPPHEAARLALDEIMSELSSLGIQAATGAQPGRQSGPGHARESAPAASKAARAKNLDTTQAAEANAPTSPMPGSREMLQKHIRAAQRGLAEESRAGH